ncbi:MAG: Eco57I restriction-modification methylase domain-containing protein [Bacteroidales bacterium]|nr:Eco57I restriction-modification methylase domain-containing protein [Bacteroidales bacterium]
MSLFQNSVIKKYNKELDTQKVQEAYALFKTYFLNPTIQANIREAKEEQFQEGFLRKLFVDVLGYTLYPDTDFNLTTELKNTSNSKKVDGAVLIDNKAVAVIELKGTDTTDLSKIEMQAFGYKNNQQYCTYVITSNFEKLRFYIDNAIDFLEFNLFTLNREDFNLLWLCLSFNSIEQNIPKKIKDESLSQEDTITKKLYKDYSLFKRELYQNLVAQNPQFEPLTLFRKSQKLLDRFLFLFFAEDRQLLPPNSVRLILNDWKDLKDRDVEISLYDRFKKYFEYLNTGFKGKRYNVFAYNGGLFMHDNILDAVTINDQLLYNHTFKLSEYDFVSEVDVNILGHIFENSLNELDEIKAQLEGQEVDKSKTKRKKDGVFYTPKYITKYIVENTVGKLCAEKKAELQINDEDYNTDKKRQKKTIQELADKLTAYKNWLLQLTICDPACGSGAFLNQALDFLINEHKYIDELQAKLFGDAFILSDIEKSILENNLYGVDLNEESVEIAKLSLWLRTAQPNRKLNDLNNNIKCGNSLIDDSAVAGEKAFNWHKEFPLVFTKKDKKIWHVVFCLFNSRYAHNHIEKTHFTGLVGFTHPFLTLKEEEILAECLSEVAHEKNLNIIECNICCDHVHAIIACEQEELQNNMRLWKGKSAYLYNRRVNPSVETQQHDENCKRPYADGTIERFWAKSYFFKEIDSEKQLEATRLYIRNNRIKHGLQGAVSHPTTEYNANEDNPTEDNATYELTRRLASFCCTLEHALRPEYKGGFDVVIGNPPYLRIQGLKDAYPEITKHYELKFKSATGNFDIYVLFIEKAFDLINLNGEVSFILPHKFLISDFGVGIRSYLLKKNAVNSLINFGSELVFQDASTYTCIISLSKKEKSAINFKQILPLQLFNNIPFNPIPYSRLNEGQWILNNNQISLVLEKISMQPFLLKDVFDRFVQGIITGRDAVFCISGNLNGNYLEIKDEYGKTNLIECAILKPHLRGEDVNKYKYLVNKEWLIFPYKLNLNKAELITPSEMQEKFPKAFEYLKKYEQELRERENGIFNNDFWYQYSRNQAISVLEQPKIITPEVCFGGSMTIDLNNFFHNSKCHTLLLNDSSGFELKSILPILNSKLFWFYLSNTGNVLRGGYIGVKRRILELFPIPLAKTIYNSNTFIEKADIMLSLNKELHKLSQKFQRSIQREFELHDLSNKLQNWHELTYAELIKELEKKKVKLSLSQKAEWEDYFTQESQKALELKSKIDATDKEIDRLVYELYGLSEEEIAIVESYS